MLAIPFWLELKAEALYFADRTSEALAVVKEAEVLAERFENHIYYAPLNRLRGVLLAAIGADDAQIEASFCAAIRIAREQKSISLEKRAERPTRNTDAKKRAAQADVDSDYLFGNFLERPAFRSTDKPCHLALSMHVSIEMEEINIPAPKLQALTRG